MTYPEDNIFNWPPSLIHGPAGDRFISLNDCMGGTSSICSLCFQKKAVFILGSCDGNHDALMDPLIDLKQGPSVSTEMSAILTGKIGLHAVLFFLSKITPSVLEALNRSSVADLQKTEKKIANNKKKCKQAHTNCLIWLIYLLLLLYHLNDKRNDNRDMEEKPGKCTITFHMHC